MAPVKLRKREHQTVLEKELDLQVENYVMAETGKEIPVGHEDAVLARLQKITESIKVHFRRNVEISEDLLKGTRAVQRGKWKEKQNLRDTSAKDESTPKKGSAADVFALEKEVEELATRIESHRQEVPKLIAQQLSEHLQQIRPSTSSDPPETGATPLDPILDTRLEPIPGLPSLEELQQKLAGAAALLPGLRKRLEAAEAKMDRVVTAVEQERLKGGLSLTEQVIAEHDKVTGYLEDKPQGRGTKRTATANLGGNPITRSRARAQE